MWCARSPRRICRGRTTALHRPRIRSRRCPAAGPASTGSRTASIRWTALPAISASSSTETNEGFGERDTDGTRGDEEMMKRTADRRRNLCVALALAGLAVMLGACNTTSEIVTQTVPTDYRQRHPIAVQEAKRSIVIFVGKARGGLSAAQHSDVMGIAQDWVREGTGSVVVDVPIDTANSRAAAATYHE